MKPISYYCTRVQIYRAHCAVISQMWRLTETTFGKSAWRLYCGERKCGIFHSYYAFHLLLW